MNATECHGQSSVVAREHAAGGRELMLRAARSRFVDEGYAATSMADIAADAGVTKAALYYHFPGKDALFVAVFVAEVERVVADLEAIAEAGGDLTDTLTAVATYAFLEAGDGVFCLHDDMRQHIDPTVRNIAFQNRTVPQEVVVRIVQQRRRELRTGLDPVLVARAFLGLVSSRMQSDKWDAGSGAAGGDDARALVDLFLHGVQAAGGAPAPAFGYADAES